MCVKYPEHYAFVFLGFTTGLRPSSLRPLRARARGGYQVGRRHAPRSPVAHALRRGHGLDENRSRSGDHLDERQLEVLRWHLDRLERENVRRERRSPEIAAAMRASELLFPAAPTTWNHGGGMRSASCLDKVFAAVGTGIGVGYSVTPRAMRRTYQDLARAAKVADIVSRSISGHATPDMQRLYSTVSGDEMRARLAKVIDIATGRELRAA